MNSSRIYYGETTINIRELIESNRKGFIRLEYYGIKSTVKEKNNVANIAENEEELVEIITTLKRNKVTPIGLEDIVKDLVRDKITD